MGIVRLNELPEGSGLLSSDDVFMFMDDPSGSGITKKISLSQISSAIGGGDIANYFNTSLIEGSGISFVYNSGNHTLAINSNPYPNIVNEARSLVTSVFNKTGAPISKFSAIYISGGQGDMPTISLASASGEMTSSKTYGITAEAISHMSTGKVIVFGALSGINTDQFNPTAPTGDVNGATLWLSPTVPGAVTTTKPTAPNHSVSVGTIIRTHQNEGVVEVRIQNGFELEELHNVSINGVDNNQILVYSSGNSLWQNANITGILPPSDIKQIYSLGTTSGNVPINYATDRQIQTVTLSGSAVNFIKGSGWPSSNTSVESLLRITVSSPTSTTWTIVNDWFNQPPAGSLAVGTHLFVLRAIGSSIVEGHYIGIKTN